MSCVYISCKSSRKRHEPGVTFHKFPTDETTRNAWIAAVRPNSDYNPLPNAIVCSKHFSQEDFDRSSTLRTYLKDGAIPLSEEEFTGDLPKDSSAVKSEPQAMGKYISRKMKKKSKNAVKGKYKSSDKLKKKPPNRNNIINYQNLCSNFEAHIEEFQNSWKHTLEENLVFYKLDVSNRPTIIVSIKIDQNLKVNVYTEHGKVAKTDMESILNADSILQQWSQLKNLLRRFDTENYAGIASIQYNLNQSMKYLKSCEAINSAKGDTFNLEPKLKFLQNQIHALLRNKYTPYMFLLAYSIYLKSSYCYKYIQNLNFLLLPEEKEIVEYVSENMKSTRERK